jgi:1,4-alpha-glucan branching enzyme
MKNGSLLLLLHAHLPYVRHPEHDYFLEENWFYESMLETYIPLLDMLERLVNDRVRFGITLSLSPTLIEMMRDSLLGERFMRHLEGLIELTEKEMQRNLRDPSLAPLSRMYNKRTKKAKRLYETRYGKDMIAAFRALGETGSVELSTTAATHAYLPVLAPCEEAVNAQIRVGMENHVKHFGTTAAGLWLPECGYYEGLESLLSGAGVKHFFLEAHGVQQARPKPKHGVFRPVRCSSGAVAFGRDSETAKAVWCSKTGYPGHPDYRDFYRDIGYDLPLKYIRPHIHPDGIRIPTGIKYYGIGGNRTVYQEKPARKRVREHAADFIRRLELRLSEGGPSSIVAVSFDAELFGHWWHEGIEWLEAVLRGLGRRNGPDTITPSEYLKENPELETVSPPPLSSWGEGGYSKTWVHRSNCWALGHVHRASERMSELVTMSTGRSPLMEKALNQALRELMLAQSSDWGFLMHKGSHSGYAAERLKGHLENFWKLERMITEGGDDIAGLEGMEDGHGLFRDVDYRCYVRSFE